MIASDEGKTVLAQVWRRILKAMEQKRSQISLNTKMIIAAATSLSFWLDGNTYSADERHLAWNFVAYLKLARPRDEETFNEYTMPDLTEESKHINGLAFGFNYFESYFFITKHGVIGCHCIYKQARRPDLRRFRKHVSINP